LVEGFHENSAAAAELESLAKSLDPSCVRGKTPIAKIAVGIALAMRYLHGKGIAHCNLTPDTILVDREWNITVANFTHSRVYPGTGNDWALIGSHYLAPECHENRFLWESDVFSFGLILFRLIVGRSPFPTDLSPLAVAKRIAIDGERPEIPDSVPPLVGGLIVACWATNPADRPSFRQIVTRLKEMDFRLARGVNPSKVASFVEKITKWEAAHGLAELEERSAAAE
jgi:myosin-5